MMHCADGPDVFLSICCILVTTFSQENHMFARTEGDACSTCISTLSRTVYWSSREDNPSQSSTTRVDGGRSEEPLLLVPRSGLPFKKTVFIVADFVIATCHRVKTQYRQLPLGNFIKSIGI